MNRILVAATVLVACASVPAATAHKPPDKPPDKPPKKPPGKPVDRPPKQADARGGDNARI